MKKLYEEPEMTVRNYVLPPNGVITTSGEGGDLGGGTDYEYDPNAVNYFE
ncbi:MAG: hypothetical protein NC397_00425 [Clostridium sp.]|nr:hypothetical protein [Clostridium sp.]